MTGPLLAFDRVGLVLGGSRLIDDLSLSVGPGERVAVLGDSGTGKSWLQRLAIGLAEPSAGTVRLMGVDLADAQGEERRRLRAHCGLVMQGGSLIGDYSVEENMRLALASPIARNTRTARRIDRLLLDFGLEASASVPAAQLSVGERRRAELARAFVRDPDLLILDEPFEGAFARADGLEEQIRRRILPHDRALLLLTQDAAAAKRFCTRIYRLERGRLIQQGAADTVPAATS
ncbi:ABC transporter ATP-binding protein [Sphingobium sp. AN641]|uniref:ABC transporter ATP-binding protein n=1 Tax=Sphingobium sp. AN641 TaxID=3133443 RepID=UPI0030C4B314